MYLLNANGDHQLKCVMSSVDGNTYCVRDRKKLKESVDLLATTTDKCKHLVVYMDEKYPNKQNVQRLVKRFDSTKLSETLPTSEHKAYSENKGERIALCLGKSNDTENNEQLIDPNTLIFVALHELAHVMTKSEGHTDEFWENFKFVLNNATEVGIYSPVDYEKKPQKYCSMTINSNPMYDMKKHYRE
tara:strand:- start:227 stop:790 length:564 start_codon:yes stop_codon:yes gene_type:complete